MGERRGTEIGVDFCIFMGKHPLGLEKVSEEENSIIKAIKSRKIYQHRPRFRGNEPIKVEPQPNAPCYVDTFIEGNSTGIRGICAHCRRYVEANKENKKLQE